MLSTRDRVNISKMAGLAEINSIGGRVLRSWAIMLVFKASVSLQSKSGLVTSRFAPGCLCLLFMADVHSGWLVNDRAVLAGIHFERHSCYPLQPHPPPCPGTILSAPGTGWAKGDGEPCSWVNLRSLRPGHSLLLPQICNFSGSL